MTSPCLIPQEFGADVITEDLSEYIAIALLVVHEKAKGKDSFWSSYIGVLPTVEDVRRGRGGGCVLSKSALRFVCVPLATGAGPKSSTTTLSLFPKRGVMECSFVLTQTSRKLT